MCHQMAMKKEAQDKQKAEQRRKAQSVVSSPTTYRRQLYMYITISILMYIACDVAADQKEIKN